MRVENKVSRNVFLVRKIRVLFSQMLNKMLFFYSITFNSSLMRLILFKRSKEKTVEC